MSGAKPSKCIACQTVPVAWSRPRVDFCYACLPGGPLAPPPCSRCGSADRYFTNGLCEGCHPLGPRHLDSCEGCLAWGVYRRYHWRCWNCRWWATHYVTGECRICRRHTTISEVRACRLCWEQARWLAPPGRAPDLDNATRYGQQLFLANLGRTSPMPHKVLLPPTRPRPRTDGNKPALPRLSRTGGGLHYTPVGWQQLVLFDLAHDTQAVIEAAAIIDNDMLRYCDQILADHAAVHGWSRKQTNDVRRALRVLAVQHHTPGGKIRASDVDQLPASHDNTSAVSTIDVLAAAGLLIDDRTSAVQRAFTKHTVGLPAPMAAQLRIWFDIMLHGSTTAPRRRPRHPETTKLHIRALAPILRVWASQGHDSLASIERHDVLAVMPPPGPRRHALDQSLRSVFGVLKTHKQVFVDPTRGLPSTPTNDTIPLPLDTAAIRAALDSPDPATALAVALVAFHALTSRQVRALCLTDITDGRLTVDGRTVPLADPVRPRLAVWLDHRGTTWPATANPHLFLSRRTAPRLTQVSRPFPWKDVGLAPQTLREDRILDEIRATGGDIGRVCHLFGLSVDAAMRYLIAADPPRAADTDPTDTMPADG